MAFMYSNQLFFSCKYSSSSLIDTYTKWTLLVGTIVDKESYISTRVLDLPAYTSGNTFSFLVFEGRDKRFDPPAKCRESNFLNRIERATNCHSFSPSFASSTPRSDRWSNRLHYPLLERVKSFLGTSLEFSRVKILTIEEFS